MVVVMQFLAVLCRLSFHSHQPRHENVHYFSSFSYKHICVFIFTDMTGVKEGLFSIRVALNWIFLKRANFTDLSLSLTNLLVSVTQNVGVWGYARREALMRMGSRSGGT